MRDETIQNEPALEGGKPAGRSKGTASIVDHFKEVQSECLPLSDGNAIDLNWIGTWHVALLKAYYEDVRVQAKRSFWFALGASVIGTVLLVKSALGDAEHFSVIAGATAQFIGLVNFYLYFHVLKQFAAFHLCLERTHRYLIASSLCEKIDDKSKKNDLWAELAMIVITDPPVNSEGGRWRKPSEKSEDMTDHTPLFHPSVGDTDGERGGRKVASST